MPINLSTKTSKVRVVSVCTSYYQQYGVRKECMQENLYTSSSSRLFQSSLGICWVKMNDKIIIDTISYIYSGVFNVQEL